MVEKEVFEEHPELHHYTNLAGLQGIVSSGTLWATRFDKLNDSTEVHHLRHRLVDAVTGPMCEAVEQVVGRKARHERRRLLRKDSIQDIARNEAAALVDSIYEVSFTGRVNSHPFAVPYIASFCSHCGDDDYLRDNGLLSQWRGYGGRERYALVFDTRALEVSLKAETATFSYMFGNFGDVIYNDDKLDFGSRFADLINSLVEAFKTYHDNSDAIAMDKVYDHFMIGATRFKHRAFREEREVRIAAAPLTDAVREHIRNESGSDASQGRRIKEIKRRGQNGSEVPYIALLEGAETPLPIKRIIIGPCTDQKRAENIASEVTNGKVKLVRSETPFIG